DGLAALKDAATAIQQVVDHIGEDTGFFVDHARIVERLHELGQAVDNEIARRAELSDATAVNPTVSEDAMRALGAEATREVERLQPSSLQDELAATDVFDTKTFTTEVSEEVIELEPTDPDALDMLNWSFEHLPPDKTDQAAEGESAPVAQEAPTFSSAEVTEDIELSGEALENVELTSNTLARLDDIAAPEEIVLETPAESSEAEEPAVDEETETTRAPVITLDGESADAVRGRDAAQPPDDAVVEPSSSDTLRRAELSVPPAELTDGTERAQHDSATIEVPELKVPDDAALDSRLDGDQPVATLEVHEVPEIQETVEHRDALKEPPHGERQPQGAAPHPGFPTQADARDTGSVATSAAPLASGSSVAQSAPPTAPAIDEEEGVDEDFDPEVAAIFTEEATELLETADRAFASWIRDRGNAAFAFELKRALHTLKGGARMAGIRAMGDLSHELESIMQLIEDGHVPAEQPVFDALQASLDELNRMRDTISQGGRCRSARALINRIRALAGQPVNDTSQPAGESSSPDPGAASASAT